MNCEEIIERLRYGKISFLDLRKEMQCVKEIALFAIEKDVKHLNLIIHKFENDIDIAKIACRKNGKLLQFFSEEIKDNSEVVSIALNQTARAIEFASERIRGNAELMKRLVKIDGKVFIYANEELKSDKNFIILGLEKRGDYLPYLDKIAPKITIDNEIIIKTLKQYSPTMMDICSQIKDKKRLKELTIEITKKADDIFVEMRPLIQGEKFEIMVDFFAKIVMDGELLIEKQEKKAERLISIESIPQIKKIKSVDIF